MKKSIGNAITEVSWFSIYLMRLQSVKSFLHRICGTNIQSVYESKNFLNTEIFIYVNLFIVVTL